MIKNKRDYKRKGFGILTLFVLFFLYISLFGDSAYARDVSSSKSVKAGYFNLNGFHSIDETGMKHGYGFELYEKMSSYLDWEVSYIGYNKTWAEMLEMLDRGEIDFLCPSSITDDREKKYSFSKYSIGTEYINVYSLGETENANRGGVSSLSGKTVGVISNTTIYDELSRQILGNGVSCKIITFDDSASLNQALSNGIVNAVALSSFQKPIDGCELLVQFSNAPVYVMTRKDDPVLEDINRALSSIYTYDQDFLTNLNMKYFSINFTSVYFSMDERKYIARHNSRTIKALVNSQMPPYCYMQDGSCKGIFPDIIKKVSEISGLNIEIVSASDKDEYLNILSSGRCDICFDALYSFNDALRMGYKLTNPYLSARIVTMQLKRDKHYSQKCGVFNPTDAYMENVPILMNESAELVWYSSLDFLVNDLDNGIIDWAYLPEYCANYISNNDVTGRFIVNSIPGESIDYSVGVMPVEDNTVLRSILNKSLNAIQYSDIDNIVRANVDIRSEAKSVAIYLYSHPYIIVVIDFFLVISIILFTLYINRTLNARREAEKNQQLLDFIKTSMGSSRKIGEIAIADNERKIFWYDLVNENGEEKLIRFREELPFEAIYDRMHPDDRKSAGKRFSVENLQKIIDNQGSDYVEVRVYMEELDKYKYYSFSVHAMTKNSLHSNSVLCFINDINEVKVEEEEKHKTVAMALNTARNYYDSKSKFLANMSHDIRTPMNAIVGMTQMALSNFNNEDRVRHCLETIDKSSDYLLGLINNILDMTKIEKGVLEFGIEPFDVKNAVTECFNLYEDKAIKKNIKFKLLFGDVIHNTIYCDRERCNQVFCNIIDNAIKYTPEHGTVSVYFKETESTNEGRHYYSFAVEDNGIGIDEGIANKVFEPFERGENAKFFEGAGLGLSIAKAIIDAVGGTIRVENIPTGGTRVIVYAALYDEPHEIDLSKINLLHGKKAMVISDDDENAQNIIDFLTSNSISCISFDNIADSMKYLERIERSSSVGLVCINLSLIAEEELMFASGIREKLSHDATLLEITNEIFDMSDPSVSRIIDGVVSSPVNLNHFRIVLSEIFKNKMEDKEKSITKSGVGKHALVVEDVEINRIFAQTIVEMKGFDVECVTNGKEAVDILLEKPENYYSIVFMDIQMPVMDGVTATEVIRKSGSEYLDRLPIIAMTANTNEEDALEYMSVGMNDYVFKPLDASSFSKVVDKYI